jgi:Diaphanous FH3 Domain
LIYYFQEEAGRNRAGNTPRTYQMLSCLAKYRGEIWVLALLTWLHLPTNTMCKPGYSVVLAAPIALTHIAFSLYGAPPKLRTLVSELLAAICVLSLDEGHKLVLGALSEFRIAHAERFRFEGLVHYLNIGDDMADSGAENSVDADDGIWDARAATLALINALTNCPESVEDRVILREEFSRRGLNEAIVVSLIILDVKPVLHHDLYPSFPSGFTIHPCTGYSAQTD